MRLAALSLSLALLTVAGAAQAQAKPEDVIRYRKAQYTVLLWNWMPLNSMVRGRIPFDAAEFARRAERVAGVCGRDPCGRAAGGGGCLLRGSLQA